MNKDPVLSLKKIDRLYGALKVFEAADLDVAAGEIVALVGPSGAGKSSLLHIAGLLEAPSAGEIWVKGRECRRLDDADRTRMRRDHMGFVYQFHHLLPEFSALSNVVLPQMIAGAGKSTAENEGRRLLARLGLAERLDHMPAQLSGGEQQRVAIARGLANKPALILADEPTGNLDPETSETVFNVFIEAVREEGAAALVATHNLALADRMDRRVEIRDRKLTSL